MSKRKQAPDDHTPHAEPEPATLEPGSLAGEERPEPQAEPAELSAPPETKEGHVQADASQETLQNLQSELEAAQAQAAEYLDGWQRSLAEFANYRKRTEREQQETYSRAIGDAMTGVLSVLDDLQRALAKRPTGGSDATWADGIELICHKLESALESQGIETIPALGAAFNPEFHQAIAQEPSDTHREGEVIEVVEQGFRMGDRVLRPAKVRIAK